MTALQEVIAEGIENQVNWRQQKAVEYPDDWRNAAAAQGLSELADYVRGLPDTDSRLHELTTLCVVDGVFSAGPDVSRELSRFRFDFPGEDCDQFLTALVRTATQEALDMGRMSGELPLDNC